MATGSGALSAAPERPAEERQAFIRGRALSPEVLREVVFLDRRNHYVVTRDGQRFLVNVTAEDDNIAPITVVMNWRIGG